MEHKPELLGTLVPKATQANKEYLCCELVWDLDQESFRVFNFSAVIGGITEYSFLGGLDSNKLIKKENEN